MHMYIQVSEGECAKLREGVPYVKLYQKTQNTYVQSLTVYEIMVIKNGGLPSVPRTIAISWPSYLSMLELAAC
jgi:hypothetical protein